MYMKYVLYHGANVRRCSLFNKLLKDFILVFYKKTHYLDNF
jgi:hypothetical protein